VIKIKLLSIGKIKESWLEEAIQEYQKRLQSQVSFEFVWAKDDRHLMDLAKKEGSLICLDPAGTLFTSEKFAQFMRTQWETAGSRLTIIIGGAEGIPQELKRLGVLISLSPLTFTHQMTRLILVEQIYRATEILKGSGYHKGAER
jgi:23S rRNA (pseudouridine1915-N3)-methyltransferase